MFKIIIVLVLSSLSLYAQSAGSTGLSFLKFGYGARNIAMGDAGTASSNDITALFYNPSKLSMQQGSEIFFMHNEWIQDVRSEVVGIRSKVFGLQFALGFNVTTISDIEVRTRPGEPDTKFDANYFYGSLSTGFNLSEYLSIGGTFKYLYEGMLSDEANGYGFDIGLNYFLPYEGLSLGAAIRNIGSMSELRLEKTKLPSEIRIGPAYTFNLSDTKFNFTTAAEFHKYLDDDANHINVGVEVFYDNLIALRGGYQTGYESRDFTAGIGVSWGNLKFDYAFLPFQLGLGSANLFSLQFKF
ncbi:MAG TPA: PorV/PorQ family protein [Ignavibacteriaceae bacterium]|nr:PorV/PorQ family protein [Ignavibacteriaceae bacterium]